MNKKAVLALVVAALGVSGGGAYAATSMAATNRTSSAPTPTNPHDLIRSAIAKAVADHHISPTERALADLFLDGRIKPDPTLRNAWRPVVQAGASALGLSARSLETDLAHGESLAAVARQQGRSPAAIAQAIESSSRDAIRKAVADGALNATAGRDILELLQAHGSELLGLRP